MQNQKTITPNSILDVKQYIFYDSDDGFVLSDPRFVKIFKSCQKALKSFDLSFKKDVPYFKMSLARCPYCGTRHVVKYGFTKRTLVFKDIGKTMVKVQRYICKRCSKTFQTDLTSLVDKNSNFTNDLKSESEHLISDYLGSLKNVCKSFKKFFGISVSHQTIENWLFVNENVLEFDLGRCSGYYIFDVEWIKVNGNWKYRHTLLDSVSNFIVADAIYDTENETTVTKFLKESTANKNKIAITTDLDKNYSLIIPKLGFNINLENYDEANKELQSLIYLENEIRPIIYKIIRKSISSRYKNFIYQIVCKNTMNLYRSWMNCTLGGGRVRNIM